MKLRMRGVNPSSPGLNASLEEKAVELITSSEVLGRSTVVKKKVISISSVENVLLRMSGNHALVFGELSQRVKSFPRTELSKVRAVSLGGLSQMP
jgi:hypothetical protein